MMNCEYNQLFKILIVTDNIYIAILSLFRTHHLSAQSEPAYFLLSRKHCATLRVIFRRFDMQKYPCNSIQTLLFPIEHKIRKRSVFVNTFVPHRNIFVINSYLFFYINNTIQTADGAHDKFAKMSIIHMRKYLNLPIIILQNKPCYMLEKTRKNQTRCFA